MQTVFHVKRWPGLRESATVTDVSMCHDTAWHLAESERLLTAAGSPPLELVPCAGWCLYVARAVGHAALALAMSPGSAAQTANWTASTCSPPGDQPLVPSEPHVEPTACELCGGPIRPNSATGVCRRTPECKREAHRRSQVAHRKRIRRRLDSAPP